MNFVENRFQSILSLAVHSTSKSWTISATIHFFQFRHFDEYRMHVKCSTICAFCAVCCHQSEIPVGTRLREINKTANSKIDWRTANRLFVLVVNNGTTPPISNSNDAQSRMSHIVGDGGASSTRRIRDWFLFDLHFSHSFSPCHADAFQFVASRVQSVNEICFCVAENSSNCNPIALNWIVLLMRGIAAEISALPASTIVTLIVMKSMLMTSCEFVQFSTSIDCFGHRQTFVCLFVVVAVAAQRSSFELMERDDCVQAALNLIKAFRRFSNINYWMSTSMWKTGSPLWQWLNAARTNRRSHLRISKLEITSTRLSLSHFISFHCPRQSRIDNIFPAQ